MACRSGLSQISDSRCHLYRKILIAVQIFKFSNLNKPVYTASGLSFLPPFLSEDFTVRRSTAKQRLIELLVAEIGDYTSKSLCLIVGTLDYGYSFMLTLCSSDLLLMTL